MTLSKADQPDPRVLCQVNGLRGSPREGEAVHGALVLVVVMSQS